MLDCIAAAFSLPLRAFSLWFFLTALLFWKRPAPYPHRGERPSGSRSRTARLVRVDKNIAFALAKPPNFPISLIFWLY